ncbi:hypothetical protein KO353_03020 [Elioraea tepida]|uniref:Uncharacterized protein n=1 Tax=Elioraea tepida TaxID=2843330 RepID=A0A975U447_9PROT|nr:hypothetical protein [Elioraea tepida]QXM25234.1 hypothetical protein KO353_03020 [Elioraea tepida]
MQLRLAARSVAGLLRAWDSVAAEVNGAAGTILCGGLFTHATKGGPYPGGLQGGLEFSRRDEEIRLCTTEITVETARIGRMTQLPWAPSAFLVLGGCKIAIASAPGHSPVAQTFALRQGVRTIRQQGVAYFSTRWNDYRRSTPADNEISLWAYARGRNVFPLFASDQRLTGIVFR